MLERLSIKNFALIDELEMKFSSGFTVMTGETGAGKTIVIEAINLICGERSNQEFIRTGCDTAFIEAEFSVENNKKVLKDLNQFLINCDEGTLIIRREITISGKSKCIINGNQVTLTMLKQICDKFIDIHGQHEHQSLFFHENQLELLDDFAGILEEVDNFTKIYKEYKDLEEKIKNFEIKKQERLQKIDFYEFQIKEIEALNLIPGEDKKLEQKSVVLRNSEKLFQKSEKIYELLNESKDALSILEQLNLVKQELKDISLLDQTQKNSLDICERALLDLKDLARHISDYRNSIEFNSEMQKEIEDRISSIQRVKKKYGNSIDDVLAYHANIKNELDEIKKQDENFSVYKDDLAKKKIDIRSKATEISKKRLKAKKDLENKIEHELQDLGMNKTKFIVEIEKEEDEINGIIIDKKSYRIFNNGIDKINFLISANPGEAPKSLSGVASGGEISRIMLALKTIKTHKNFIPTVIFDEIDTGVGGAIASKLGKKLQDISIGAQVIAITHLPQIASLADNHFFISKNINKERTVTDIKLLDKKARIEEVARMLAGEKITELTLKHAKELMNLN